MAAGSCGTKKQKLNDSSSLSCKLNPAQNMIKNGMIAHRDMGYYCFDVLYRHLHSMEAPKSPNFSNDP